ncbi:heavy metal translocating P-type ATPase [Desulfoglaeba alkanexedens]|uniref:P-type Zn(2+) transporter n=1 Tax=Desulfoglaeba alkanexedens ALDC TaxID=980445 RepID=A0A4P8L7H6_9BACT|nr:cation-translocating P-type ATPase [Desulfoglaeba alkanexedens]QCQ22592.1 cation-translocating P-type ATPase [Desulfoglaeba alkanexedens ALDC]
MTAMNTGSEKFRVKSRIPGRLRLRVPAIRFSKERADALQAWLSSHPSVVSAEARPRSASVILFFDPHHMEASVILDIVSSALSGVLHGPLDRVSLSGHTACGLDCKVCHPIPRTLKRQSLKGRLVEVVAITAFVGYTLIRRLLFKSPLAQGPFSIVAGVALIAAIPLFRHALEDLRQGKAMSLFPFLAGTCVLAIAMGEAMTALEVIWILRVGMLLEDYVAEQSRRAISEILQVATKDTYILVDGVEVQVPVDQVQKGDLLIVHTGEKIPVDGIVERGEALVDEAHITGRAEPELRSTGDRVFAGTIVQKGVIVVSAEKVGDDTYLCRILHMVEDAIENRAPAEKQADVLAGRLFRLGAFATVTTLLLTADPLRAFTVMLVMACPCATVLAASTAVSAALANAARNRILIKGGLHLETVGKADCFCFDKTGTITAEVPEVIEVIPRAPGQTEVQVLATAAIAEIHNEHPMAKAVLYAAKRRDIEPAPHAECEFVLGRGVTARTNGDVILVGNDRFMKEHQIPLTCFNARSDERIGQGNTVLYVAKNGKLQGMIVVANGVKPNAKAVLDWLRKDGVSSLYLVTGDTQPVAEAIAQSMSFDDYRANLLPEDKASYVERLEQGGKRVVMIGDGVNDALALSKATVGVAMGAGGAEVAIEAADIALVDSELEHLVTLRQLSHKTLRTIEQNYYLATSTNVLGVVLGAAGWLTPVMAGMLHIVHTLGILLNSSRLLNWKAPGLPQNREKENG